MRLLTDAIRSPIGTLHIAARDGRLCALDFERFRNLTLSSLAFRYGTINLEVHRDPFKISGRIRAYLAGDLAALDAVPVESGGTDFQRRVWSALRGIPPGQTVTYAELASAAGRPAAARAAGSANALNPIAIAIPCHRVVGSNSSLTGYGGGLWRKRWLLRHEGTVLPGSVSRCRSVASR